MLANGIPEVRHELYVAVAATAQKAPRHLSVEGRSRQPAESVRRNQKSGFRLDSLLDPQHHSLSLTELARSASLSGKRLIIEVRDQHPVKIVRFGEAWAEDW
jgi:hypothetical protein